METKMPPFTDTRQFTRFTQSEEKTFACLTNPETPQWQKDFAYYAWYTQTPLAVWNDGVLQLDKKQATDLLYGKPVELDEQAAQRVTNLTRAMQHLLSTGALPCTDKRAVLGILKNGVDIIAWGDYYAAQQGG